VRWRRVWDFWRNISPRPRWAQQLDVRQLPKQDPKRASYHHGQWHVFDTAGRLRALGEGGELRGPTTRSGCGDHPGLPSKSGPATNLGGSVFVHRWWHTLRLGRGPRNSGPFPLPHVCGMCVCGCRLNCSITWNILLAGDLNQSMGVALVKGADLLPRVCRVKPQVSAVEPHLRLSARGASGRGRPPRVLPRLKLNQGRWHNLLISHAGKHSIFASHGFHAEFYLAIASVLGGSPLALALASSTWLGHLWHVP
jgi:hypothetical protein